MFLHISCALPLKQKVTVQMSWRCMSCTAAEVELITAAVCVVWRAGRRKQNEAGVGELWLRLTASVDPMRSSEARITIRGLLLRVEFDQRSNCQHPLDHQSKRVPEKHLFPLYWQRQSLWLCGSQKIVENSSRDGNTRPPDLPPEKSVCRSGRNS